MFKGDVEKIAISFHKTNPIKPFSREDKAKFNAHKQPDGMQEDTPDDFVEPSGVEPKETHLQEIEQNN